MKILETKTGKSVEVIDTINKGNYFYNNLNHIDMEKEKDFNDYVKKESFLNLANEIGIDMYLDASNLDLMYRLSNFDFE